MGLERRGHDAFQVFEQSGHPGGLGASFRDAHGFVWDIGAHLHLRRKPEYIRLLDDCGSTGWNAHGCGAWIWTHGRLIPHPFQQNLKHLPEDAAARCAEGLRSARAHSRRMRGTLQDWIVSEYGTAIAEEFLLPYCRKAWAYDPSAMSAEWAVKRFPSDDTPRPSAPTYPAEGGNGIVWQHLAERLGPRLRLSAPVNRVDTSAHRIQLRDGTEIPYSALVSTMPLDRLIEISDSTSMRTRAVELHYTSLLVIGLGFRGARPELFRGIGWFYSAEPEVPFFRATVHSNLSPGNVPAGGYWSLLLEISHPPGKRPVTAECIDASIGTLAQWGAPVRQGNLVSTWIQSVERAYPIPTAGRAAAVATLLDTLRKRDVHSIGRFGAWRYENANQDDCFEEGLAVAAELM